MSQIIALDKTKPIKGEKYFVDTNVWFWTTYVGSKLVDLPKNKHPQEYQLEEYPRFIEIAISDGAQLCHSTLVLAELASVIEQTELELYRNKVGNEYFEKKEFRKLPAERSSVLEEIDLAWKTINEMSHCLKVSVDMDFLKKAGEELRAAPLDPYDALHVQAIRSNKIDYLITDDADYVLSKNLMLLTANARACG